MEKKYKTPEEIKLKVKRLGSKATTKASVSSENSSSSKMVEPPKGLKVKRAKMTESVKMSDIYKKKKKAKKGVSVNVYGGSNAKSQVKEGNIQYRLKGAKTAAPQKVKKAKKPSDSSSFKSMLMKYAKDAY